MLLLLYQIQPLCRFFESKWQHCANRQQCLWSLAWPYGSRCRVFVYKTGGAETVNVVQNCYFHGRSDDYQCDCHVVVWVQYDYDDREDLASDWLRLSINSVPTTLTMIQQQSTPTILCPATTHLNSSPQFYMDTADYIIASQPVTKSSKWTLL